MKNISKEYCVAVHEAGHAVMSVIYKKNLEYVTIMNDENKVLGECKCSGSIPSENETDEAKGLRLQGEILILIAGTTAEAVILNINPMDSRGNNDYEKAEKILAAPNDGRTSERANYIHELAFNIIKNPFVQRQIKTVADALMEHKTLSGSEVSRIMAEAI